jgi:hypothetical protein
VYGRPAPNTADHTQVRFWTDDVERDVRDLENRGAIFEDYDFPTLKTVNHVATTPALASQPGSKIRTGTRWRCSSPNSRFNRRRWRHLGEHS